MKIFSFLLLPLFALLLVSCSQELSDSSPVSPETELTKAWTNEENDMAYAYHYLQAFNNVNINQWKVEGGVIAVDLVRKFKNETQMFCVVEDKESSKLYFLERPSDNSLKFELPSKGLVNDVIDV